MEVERQGDGQNGGQRYMGWRTDRQGNGQTDIPPDRQTNRPVDMDGKVTSKHNHKKIDDRQTYRQADRQRVGILQAGSHDIWKDRWIGT